MNYLVKDDENNKILIYKCIIDKDKVYEYRKREMESNPTPFKGAIVLPAYGYGPLQNREEGYINTHNIKVERVYDLIGSDCTQKELLELKKDLLEQYYKGELVVEEYWNDNTLVPKKVYGTLIPDYFRTNGYYYRTTDLIVLTNKLRKLERLVAGEYVAPYHIGSQLSCIDFEYIGSVDISVLPYLLDSNITYYDRGSFGDAVHYLNKKAEDGKALLELKKKSNI